MNEYICDFLQRYPLANHVDCVKLLYQAHFGCEHIFCDQMMDYAQSEMQVALADNQQSLPLCEMISDNLCRVNLAPFASCGLLLSNLATLMKGAVTQGTKEQFTQTLRQFCQDIKGGCYPTLDARQTSDFLDYYLQLGCPALHHSDCFRNAYKPHYRVASRHLLQQMLGKLDK